MSELWTTKRTTHIDIGGVIVIRIGYAINLLQHDTIVVVGNAFLVLVLLHVIPTVGVLARVILDLNRLKLELVEDGKLAALLAEL